jgi:hypothetical protein
VKRLADTTEEEWDAVTAQRRTFRDMGEGSLQREIVNAVIVPMREKRWKAELIDGICDLVEKIPVGVDGWDIGPVMVDDREEACVQLAFEIRMGKKLELSKKSKKRVLEALRGK